MRTMFGRGVWAAAGSTAADRATVRIATHARVIDRPLLENLAPRVHLRGIVFAEAHRGHRRIALRHRPRVGSLVRAARALLEYVPVDGATGRVLHLGEALLAALRPRLRRHHVALVAARRDTGDVHVEERAGRQAVLL